MLRTMVAAAAALFYPAGVWYCLHIGHPALAAAVVAVAALAAGWLRRSKASLLCAALAVLLATLTAMSSQALAIKLYPVIVNAVMLSVFAASLAGGQSVCERFARLRHKELAAHAVAYCRGATAAWCVFFIVNGAVALDSALWRSDDWWALYNGFFAY
ncbi:MAG: hypothetical protein ACI4SV_01715, partial [Duodenibacillus sp.]